MPLFIYEFGKGVLLFHKMWSESVLQNSSQRKGWKCKVEQYMENGRIERSTSHDKIFLKLILYS